jgi:hypothetical protein
LSQRNLPYFGSVINYMRLDTKNAFSPAIVQAVNRAVVGISRKQTILAFLLAFFAAGVIGIMSVLIMYAFLVMGAFGALACLTCENSSIEVASAVIMLGVIISSTAFWGIFVAMKHRDAPKAD